MSIALSPKTHGVEQGWQTGQQQARDEAPSQGVEQGVGLAFWRLWTASHPLVALFCRLNGVAGFCATSPFAQPTSDELKVEKWGIEGVCQGTLIALRALEMNIVVNCVRWS